MFAVRGLVAAGRTYGNSYSIRKACNFVLSKQQATGGWGESYLSSEKEVMSLIIILIGKYIWLCD
jgi:achilleol B synthase